MKRLITIILLILSAATELAGQEYASVKGVIYDESRKSYRDYKPTVVGATVLLVTEKADTLYTTSNHYGQFFFNKIAPQSVHLKIVMVGMETIEGDYALGEGANAFFFNMNERKEQLQAASVSAKMDVVKHSGDTTIFNAKAIRMMDTETAKDLLEQMPGVEIKGNSIKVNGESVKRTYVNGVLVFGDDPMNALSAMKAGEIKQIQVYDEADATDVHRGIKNARRETVLNVITNEVFLSFTDAGVTITGGADESGKFRYSSAALASFNSEFQDWKVVADASNVNRFEAMGLLGMTSKTVASTVPHISSSDIRDVGFGAQLTKYWKDRLFGNKLHGRYLYSNNEVKSASKALTEMFETADNPAMTIMDSTASIATTGRHMVDLFLDMKDTPIKSFFVSTNLTVDEGSSRSQTYQNRSLSTGEVSRTETDINSNSDNYSFSTIFLWENNDAVKIRPRIRTTVDYSKSNNLSWTIDTLSSSFSRRQLQSDGFGNDLNVSSSFDVSYVAINNEKHSLNLRAGYEPSYQRGKNKQLTVDMLDVDDPLLAPVDLANTYDYSVNNIRNQFYFSSDYQRAKKSFACKLAFDDIIVMDDERYPDPYNSTRRYSSFSPSLTYYDMKNMSTIVFGTYSAIPSVEQTRNRISDANPLALVGGNPNLKISTAYHLTSGFAIKLKKSTCMLTADATITANPMVTKSTFFTEDTVLSDWDGYLAKKGSMLYTTVNSASPSFQSQFGMQTVLLMFSRKLRVTPILSVGYGIVPQYAGETLQNESSFRSSLTLSMAYRPSRKFTASISPLLVYTNSMRGQGDVISERLSMTTTFKIEGSFLDNFRYNISDNWSKYVYLSGLGNNYDKHRLNASIGCYFLNKKVLVQLQGFDLLNTGVFYSSTTNAVSMTQSWMPTYGRFAMLSFNWFFEKKSM